MAHILIVDDDPSACSALGRIISTAGHDFVTAESLDDALEACRNHAFELILSDVNLPDGSGIELARKVAGRYPDTGIVMVTGVDDPVIGTLAVEIGASGYLIKPFKPNEIYITVINALHRRKLELSNKRHTEQLERAVLVKTIDLQRAVDELKASQQQLLKSSEEMVHRLSKAAEFRDDETAEHLQRMSRYSRLLAQRLDLSEARCEQIRLASIMHDVGKIGIPDSILLKPGKLTKEEFATMKSHTSIGHKILSGSDSPLLKLAATVALGHHEKYDGSGYPAQLAGEAIPLEGRIVAVTDVFDAITSKRVYKDAMPFDEAVKIIEEGRGGHFDPDLVDHFLDALDEIRAIQKRFGDSVDPRPRRASESDEDGAAQRAAQTDRGA